MTTHEESGWVGKHLGKYKVLKLLGCGGMGAVYQAYHTMLEKMVCLKTLSSLTPDQKMLERFLREAKAVAKLDHANIVRVYDIEKEDNVYFMVMEYIDGKTLAQVLEEKDAVTIREALNIVMKVALALEAAHRQHVIHRDIKLENIMISHGGEVKLADFGLAVSLDIAGKISNSSELWGTPLYLAPESIKGDFADHRVDLYALGIMLYYLLAGEPPFSGRNPITILRQHVEAPIPAIRQARPDVPEDVERLIKKLMAKEPRDRVATAEELIASLNSCLNAMKAKQSMTTERYLPSAPEVEFEQVIALSTVAPQIKIRVLIVDDSPVMCKMLSKLLQSDHSLEVVGIAYNGEDALNLIPQVNPDVITLDFNMAIMDGTSTLKCIITKYPRPVIMLSAFTYEGACTTFDCLSYGAVDFIWKTAKSHQDEFKRELLEKIHNAAQIQLAVPTKMRVAKSYGLHGSEAAAPRIPARCLVVIIGGAGGYHSCLKIIPHIPKNIPCAIVLVQEMPIELTNAFTHYLDQYSRLTVKEIVHEDVLTEGVCYLTNHLTAINLKKLPDDLGYQILTEPSQYPSADTVFFPTLSQAAAQFHDFAMAIALTGDMANAVAGLKQIKEVGGMVIVQRPETCLKPTTVQAAIAEKLVDKVVTDVDIPSVLWHLLKKKMKK